MKTAKHRRCGKKNETSNNCCGTKTSNTALKKENKLELFRNMKTSKNCRKKQN